MRFSRRDLLKASVATAALAAAPARVRAAAPEPVAVTPALIEAAKKEGKVVWYAAMDLPVSERVARGFEAKYPGIAVRIERTGSERQFQRLAQEYAANIFVADVINASDAAHFIAWKRNQWLAAFVPEEVARFYPAEHRDPDGLFATLARLRVLARLQHQHGQARGRAEVVRRSAGAEMDRQDRQGASELQRHHHDRDLPDRARARLGLFREARQAEGAAGAVLGRPAEEARARRARRDGRRQRFQPGAAEGAGPAGRDRLSDRGLAADQLPERRAGASAQSQRSAAVPELPVLARRPAAPDRLRRPAFRPCPGQGEAGTQAACRDQGDEGRSGRGRGSGRGNQGALFEVFRGVSE